MAKMALCVGINDYPGGINDLRGCVNDANDWADLLNGTFGFAESDITMLLDSQATKQAITNGLSEMISSAGMSDVVVFTFSGHGTWKKDESGDEPDGRDEAICAYDGIILDDDLRVILDNISPDVHFTFISDSCHSGSVTKQILERSAKNKINRKGEDYAPRPRFMPPDLAAEIYNLPIEQFQLTNILAYFQPVISSIWSLFAGLPEVLISGCLDTEYSYDAYINGRFNGAMTAIATTLMRQNPNRTYLEFHKDLRQYLPSNSYKQSPQLGGKITAQQRKLFT